MDSLIWFYILAGIGIFIIGWSCHSLYQDLNEHRILNGINFQGNYTHMEAIQQAQKFDDSDGWVCLNSKGMQYSECVDTAKHECGHELWAKMCQKNNKLCLQAQEMLNNYSN